MPLKFDLHIKPDETQTIIKCLSENIELSSQQLKKLMQNGGVWLDNSHGIHRVRRAKKNINKGECLHVYYDADIQNISPPQAVLIADEKAYSIWNKPCGMYSQGTKWGDHCTIYRWAEQNLEPQRPAFIVHRLDKSANGLIVIAHTKKIAAAFSKMFEQRKINKKYKALVEGNIENISLPFEIKNKLDGKAAISEIISLQQKNNKTEVEIKIKTGRKHQIRRHLSGMGYPIVGDRLYGKNNATSDLQLSSVELEFCCPITGELKTYSIRDVCPVKNV